MRLRSDSHSPAGDQPPTGDQPPADDHEGRPYYATKLPAGGRISTRGSYNLFPHTFWFLSSRPVSLLTASVVCRGSCGMQGGIQRCPAYHSYLNMFFMGGILSSGCPV